MPAKAKTIKPTEIVRRFRVLRGVHYPVPYRRGAPEKDYKHVDIGGVVTSSQIPIAVCEGWCKRTPPILKEITDGE